MTSPDTDTAGGQGGLEQGSTAVGFRSRANLVIVDAIINGQVVPMVLDTGAGMTIVGDAAARRIGLNATNHACTGRGAGGDVDMSGARIDTFTVGSATHANLSCMVMDMSSLCEKIGADVQGIIGANFLSNYRLTIDYPQQRLALH